MSVTAGPLLEREDALARVGAELEATRAGEGRFVLVEGIPGIGKSALLARVRALANEDGMTVLTARGGELEREWPFGVVRQLFEPVLARARGEERAALLAGAARQAAALLGFPGAAAPAAPDAAASPDSSFAVLHGLYWLTANLAEASPVCVVVDDAQWSDTASARFLAFLLPRLRSLPVALVVARRPEDPADPGPISLAADGHGEPLRPQPLGERSAARMIETALGASPAPGFTAACLRASGGVPFLLGELCRVLAEDGIVPREEAAGRVEGEGSRSVGRWAFARLARLGEPAGAVARAVAVLETASPRLAAELAGATPEEVAEAADRLATAGILAPGRPLTFAHPLLRAGLLGSLGTHERARAHRRAAELLAAEPDGAARSVEHLLATEPAGDPWVVDQLRTAAAGAMRSGAPESAAAYLRRALAEPPATATRSAVAADLGVAEASAGDTAGLDHLREAVELATAPEDRLRAGLMLGYTLGFVEAYGEAIDSLDRAVAPLPADDPARRLFETQIASVAMLDAGTARQHRARLERARTRVDEVADPLREELALAAIIAVEQGEPADVPAGLARRALATSPQPWPLPEEGGWFAQLCVALVWSEHYEEARSVLDRAIATLTTQVAAAALSGALTHRAWLHLDRGDLRAAEADVATLVGDAELPPPRIYDVLAHSLLVGVRVTSGDLEGAEVALDDLPDAAEGGSQPAATHRIWRARLRLAQGRVREALADARASGEVALACGAPSPTWNPWRSVAAAAHAALGEPEAGLALAEEELRLARAARAPRAAAAAARTAGAIRGGITGETLMREALAELPAGHAPLEATRLQVELGALLRHLGRKSEARDVLRDGLDRADRLQARPLADRAAEELRAAGARPRRAALSGPDALTASERRVAQLAAEGRTNREIAEALFVSARTVEGHLTRVFGKLGVGSREALGPALNVAA